MKDFKIDISNLKSKISKVEDEKYRDIFEDISDILNSLSNKVEEIMMNEAALAENIKYMDDDISDIQDELFEEVSLEELDEMEAEYKEVSCAKCGKPIYIEASALKKSSEIPCPYCGENII